MAIGRIYTLAEAAKIVERPRNLITYLVRDRQIPHQRVGMAIILDEEGLMLLREAIADYEAKFAVVA